MDHTVSQIPRSTDWPVSFPLQSAVEFVLATSLQLETIVSRLSLKLGGRLAHCKDSYRTIDAQWIHLDILRRGYSPPWLWVAPQQRVAPRNPVVSQKASDVLDVEVQGLLEKGAIREASPVPSQYVSSYFAVPKSIGRKPIGAKGAAAPPVRKGIDISGNELLIVIRLSLIHI